MEEWAFSATRNTYTCYTCTRRTSLWRYGRPSSSFPIVYLMSYTFWSFNVKMWVIGPDTILCAGNPDKVVACDSEVEVVILLVVLLLAVSVWLTILTSWSSVVNDVFWAVTLSTLLDAVLVKVTSSPLLSEEELSSDTFQFSASYSILKSPWWSWYNIIDVVDDTSGAAVAVVAVGGNLSSSSCDFDFLLLLPLLLLLEHHRCCRCRCYWRYYHYYCYLLVVEYSHNDFVLP